MADNAPRRRRHHSPMRQRTSTMTMPHPSRRWLLAPIAAALLLAACGDRAMLPPEAEIGPTPTLPAPNPTLLPTVNIAPSVGWTDTAGPTAPAGFVVTALR